jgi:hypothetical protein
VPSTTSFSTPSRMRRSSTTAPAERDPRHRSALEPPVS